MACFASNGGDMSSISDPPETEPRTRIRSSRIEDFLQVGVQAQFDLDASDKRSLRLTGTLVGWESGQYLLVHAEFHETQSRLLNAKLEGVLRFIADGRICTMRTRPAEGAISKADPMLRLHWPEEVDAVSIRRESRATISAEGSATLADDVTVPCEVINISSSGCRLYIPLKVSPGDPLTCTFELPNGRVVSDEPCVVRHVRHQGEGMSAGCEFVGLSPQSERAIEFYIATGFGHDRKTHVGEPRLLVYEDVHGSVDEDVALLRLHGLDIVKVHSLVKAFTWLGISMPDALFISCGQSEIDPVEVCRIVRNTTGCKSLPIFVYGTNDTELFEKLREAGGNGLMPPLSELDEILRLLAVEEIV